MRALNNHSKNLLHIKIVVKPLNFVFLIQIKKNLSIEL